MSGTLTIKRSLRERPAHNGQKIPFVIVCKKNKRRGFLEACQHAGKSFLRFLYLLDEYCAKTDQPRQFLYGDVVRMMRDVGSDADYGFHLFLTDAGMNRAKINDNIGLAHFKGEEGQLKVEITELGKGLASQLFFPAELEEAIRARFAEGK